ncbi:MAG: transposase zinc-binding domain-containing protein, partial [Planctomycetota bacterium]
MPLLVRGAEPYRPRRPAETVLYRVVARHVQAFLARTDRDPGRADLPGFVRRELLSLLDCGILARGFLRVRCPGCRQELLVGFSCKGRGFCPSCGGRRMADTAAHLVDRVLPHVPVRQWVLSLPFGLRFAVAFDRALCRAVRAAFMDGVLGALRRRARRQGVADGRSGAVVCVQRFGSALNLNVHFHALVLDGVFHREPSRKRPVFRAATRLGEADLTDVLQAVIAKVLAVLRRHGLSPGDEEVGLFDMAERSPALADVQADSIAGRRTVRVGRLPGLGFVQPTGPDCVAQDGFSLHAGVCVPGGPRTRERLEQLCRYVARPALATERLSEPTVVGWDAPDRVAAAGLPGEARGAGAAAAGAPHDVPRRAGAGGGDAGGDRAGTSGEPQETASMRHAADQHALVRKASLGGTHQAGVPGGRAALPALRGATQDPGGDHGGSRDPRDARLARPAHRAADRAPGARAAGRAVL